MEKRKIALPHYGEYSCAFKYLFEIGLEVKYILPPPLTQHTIDIGSRNSPDFVCTPFKTILGSQIEALEAGADTLLMVHGMCKLGYFGELEEQILRDLGYNFEFINLTSYDTGRKKDFVKVIKRINPKVKYRKVLSGVVDAIKMVEYVDEITSEYYKNCGFELDKGAYRRAYRGFIASMYAAASKSDIEAGYRKVKEAFAHIPIDKPGWPLRVGIVGDFYTAMDAFSNLEVEKKLADLGVPPEQAPFFPVRRSVSGLRSRILAIMLCGQSIPRRLPQDVPYLPSLIWFIRFRWDMPKKTS